MNTQEFLDSIISLDLETTGVEEDSEIVEIGINGDNILIIPERDIPPEASSVHGISRKLCEDKGFPLKEVQHVVDSLKDKIVVGHGVEYDINILKEESKNKGLNIDSFAEKYICTLTLMKKIFRNEDIFDNYKLGYLFFMMGLEDNINDPEEIRFHRAGFDSKATKMILGWIIDYLINEGRLDLNKDIYDQLHKIMTTPVTVVKCPFGKHKGKDIDSVPVDYWIWCIQNTDIFQEEQPNYDEDFVCTVFDIVERTMG